MNDGVMLKRLLALAGGLVLYGVSMSMILHAGLGNIPWDVLHQGLAGQLGLSVGTVTIIVGAAVLVTWLPLRQRPGFGTVSNVVVIGLAFDAASPLLPDHPPLLIAIPMMLGGIVVNAFATALYIGARLGPGPRDGLMTGIVARTGWPVRVVRTGLEVIVVAIGFLMGGTLGVGTVLYAVGVGPLIQWFARVMGVDRAVAGDTGPRRAADPSTGPVSPGPVSPGPVDPTAATPPR
ncbi:YczE/YyaS/YitT family protein [Gordonia sp. (in: high G+C Gram-positive bacteria)]|uniref:membrane protein YczE n=2 Tax=Gordonia sp. (in: high G+C Gram-positive bacteria) TaxID=84139 RepID=UPI003C737C6E